LESEQNLPVVRKRRCAVYTRKSTEEGLEMEFNSLDAQREACEAYIASQKAEGWLLVPDRYDDGGFSGGNLERRALKRLLDDNCISTRFEGCGENKKTKRNQELQLATPLLNDSPPP
jgi:hypothetical protein